MEDSSCNKSQRSFRASSEGPSPPPRSAKEDGDASATRKRPRLDSGDRTYRSLSAEASSVGSGLQKLRNMGKSSEKGGDSDAAMEEQSMTSPRSKVTLNIKEQSASSLTNGIKETQGQEQTEIPDSQESLSKTQSMTPQSRSPSPLGSPEIEVAEPEDASDYIGPTIWMRPGGKSIEERRLLHMDTFPMLHETEDWRHVITKIAMAFQYEDNDIGCLFNQLSDFMDHWILLADESPPKIWDLWSPDSDLWNLFPTLNEALLKRTTPATVLRTSTSGMPSNEIDLTEEDSEDSLSLNNHERNDKDPFLRYLKTIIALLGRILHMDRQTLIETAHDTAEPDLGGKPFIQLLHTYCVGGTNVIWCDHIWRQYSGGRWKAEELLDGLMMEFLHCNGLENMVYCMISLIERSPTDLDYAASLLSVAAGVLAWTCRLDKKYTDLIHRIYSGLSILFNKSFTKFEELIRKQVSGFTIEIIQRYIIGLADCLKHLCILDYQHTIKLLPANFDDGIQRYMKQEESIGEQAGELLPLKLKLEMAFLCLKNGRMESRVAGVESYGDTLLQIYKQYHYGKREGDELHPLVALCKDFIQDKDLISYLVGVDSHPQVVSRSKNIIGFQVITRCYTQRDTDTIWTAMRSSQDPRRSEAIMDILLAQVDYADTSVLQTFVEKFIDLPIEAYDGKMRYFVKSLLQAASGKTQRPSPLVETICSRVLIPFLQECLRYPNLSLKERKDRWDFAAVEFRTAASHDLTPRAKSEISAMAVKSVEKAGYESTAGIAILGMFIDARYHGFEYGRQPYCATDKFAELVVNDLGRCSDILQETGLREEDVSEILKPRLDLIERSLQAFNAWPYQDWMESLWQNLVGNNAVNDKARDCGYGMLAKLFRAAITRIDFLDACIQTFFGKLGHDNMTASILEFAKEASAYYERFMRNTSSSDDEDQASKPLPGDMFWYIALTAESQDVVERATHFFVDYNLSTALAIPADIIEDNHVRLVDRCVAQLTTAASKIKPEQQEDISMSNNTAESGPQAAKLHFSRSLHILKLFLTKIREKRLGSPIVRNDSPISNHSVHGEEMIFTFYDPIGSRQIKRSLTIGSESPLKELVARLCRATGCSKIKIFAGGQPIDQGLNAATLLQDVPVLNSSRHLLIQKFPGSSLLREEKSSNKLLPLEQQVLVHFDKLYELLSLNDEMGKEACNFLMTFPPEQEILSNSTSDLLPLESPYKSIYCCYVLKTKLLLGLGEGASCEEDLKILIRGVGDALIRFVATPDEYFTSPKDTLLLHMTDCLSVALKESVSDDVAASYFPDASSFINSVVKVLEAALLDDENRDRVPIVYYCFAIVLEATIKNVQAWEAFKIHPKINDILKASWLASARTNVRTNTTQTVKSICAVLPLKLISTAEFLDFFWNQTLALVPSTQDYPNQSRQFFDVAMTIYIAKSEHSPVIMPLEDYFTTWSTMLLSHHPQGSSPTHDQDTLVDGLTDMLAWTIQLIKSKKQSIKGTAGLLEGIFTTHVFPHNHSSDDHQKTQLHVPILSSSTRAKLYTLMISLTSDQETFQTLIKLLKQTVPNQAERSGAWASGVAQPLEDQSDAPWIIEREKIVRTSAGYAGLKNLSNTCYLNSLFMQLFMNVRFRDFMLHISTVDPGKTQILLHETQKLFAYLQETWLKSVDPSNVVENIITFDGEPIDVHVQMDVDEFYNLLFDRWENQIMSEEDKKKFRRFYGGELVQQIKSQDCAHVSERFEPFSVIQCEIQGKSGLTDSLNAFIEGEMMQGDNKYKCSSCETYVNAVKRACLKVVPDNLIFHLKRFDYDLVHGTRHKINDQFEFPMELDMAPYNVEYLKDPRGTPKPDMFMLVGILVHSGTAEIGHYYSFIRERPGIKDTWIEMNDSEVSSFDPANIPHNCFGGWDHTAHPGWAKSYNAYMLFYQRIVSMKEDSVSYPTETAHAVRTEIPSKVLSQLVSENELWVRKYCLLDQSYVKFSRDVLEKYRDLFQGQCTDSHILEANLIDGTIRQIELIFARVKDCKYLDELLRSFERILRKCIQCTAIFLKTITNDGTFRNLLFRCPQDIVRQKLADEIFHGLTLLKEHEPRLYDLELGSPESPSSQDNTISSYGVFQEVLCACDNIVETIPMLTKGWDDFWSFICRLGSRGHWELSQVQDRDYFTRVLQIVSYNGGLQQVPDWSFANNYHKLRSRKRYSMANLVNLFIMIFRGYVDTLVESESDDKFDRIQLSEFEHKILSHNVPSEPKGRTPANVILAGILQLHGLDAGMYRSTMECFMRYNDEPIALRLYQSALSKGASVSPASLSTSYLSAASAFIENCSDERAIHFLVNKFAEGVHTIGDEAGHEHLQFFNQLRFAYNPHFPNYQPAFLKQVLAKKLYMFVPHLLCYHESDVRRGTAAMANALIFDVDLDNMDDEQQAEEIQKLGKHLTIECLNKLTGIIDARKLFDIKRLDNLIDVIRSGIEKFCDEDNEDEDDNVLRAKFDSKYPLFFLRIHKLTMYF